MAALPYLQLYVADYLADTVHLETDEHGAYLLLIMNYWQTGKPIPVERLRAITKLSNDRWTTVQRSLNGYFKLVNNCWLHERLECDLALVNAAQMQRSEAGKASALARLKRQRAAVSEENSNGRSTGVQRSFNGHSNGRSTNKDTDTDTETKKAPPTPAPAGEPPAGLSDPPDQSRQKTTGRLKKIQEARKLPAALAALGVSAETWSAYIDARAENRSAKFSTTAIELCVSKIAKRVEEGMAIEAVMEPLIERGWIAPESRYFDSLPSPALDQRETASVDDAFRQYARYLVPLGHEPVLRESIEGTAIWFDLLETVRKGPEFSARLGLSVAFWIWYFETVSMTDWASRDGFRPGFDYLVKPEVVARIISSGMAVDAADDQRELRH